MHAVGRGWAFHDVFRLRRGHLRGHGGAREGGTVALATTLTRLSSSFYTRSVAYEVALCVRA